MGIQSKSKNAEPYCGFQEVLQERGFFGSTNVMIPGKMMQWIRNPNVIQDIEECELPSLKLLE